MSFLRLGRNGTLVERKAAVLRHNTTGAVRPSPRQFATKASPMASHEPFEEETLPGYEAEEFYPVHIGEKLNARYEVLGKLGYGASATAWLCRDLKAKERVAIKIYDKMSSQHANREQEAYDLLTKVTRDGPLHHHVRQLLDSFRVTRSDAADPHLCLVHQPLHTSLYSFQRFGGVARPLPESLAKSIIRYILEALDFLHTDAGITHCDIKLSNLMLQIEDMSVLDDFERAEQEAPCARKVVGDTRTIYATRRFQNAKGHAYGPPILCDLGEARIGSSHQYEEIQPEVYKAPEILMQLDRWDHSVDIWNLACVVWDMIEVDHLFDGYDDEGYHNNGVHMREMVNLLGRPPRDFLSRSPHTWRLFDQEGNWKGRTPLAPVSLEARIQSLSGDSKTGFADFLSSMLCWLPDDRKTAGALLRHPWLEEA
ncbi:uncharacterized protein LTR77_005552 [Saxophila tyrrhenica]|uniref:non-specific serine/threonine protein kinase n=1 Tax=Saxophila tyrrhenica TaxID=1690608 RepID=A0AAV9P9H0_9PEZI|nr:hypothetical protein LTR77_005552 [Saxophila tyrrhenica]